jgi:CspA family cold shock protein
MDQIASSTAEHPIETPPANLPTIPACPEGEDIGTVGKKTGQCKWFSNVHGYGFLTICVGDDTGVDVFVHHSGIRPANSMYKSLVKGEYVTFDVVDGAQGTQAVNVRGINGGTLLCDHVQTRRAAGAAAGASHSQGAASASRGNTRNGARKSNGAGGGRRHQQKKAVVPPVA